MKKFKLTTVVELPPFLSTVGKILTQSSERDDLISYIAQNPEVGDEIPKTGGLRKLRWSAKGKGRRGGARVIYYFYNYSYPVFLLYIYEKGSQENLKPEQEKMLVKLASILKNECRNRRDSYVEETYW